MIDQQTNFIKDLYFRSLGRVVRSWENPAGLLRPLWRDASKWNGNINFQVSKDNGVQGWFFRAGYYIWEDSKFSEYWNQSGDFGFYRSSYHVIYTAYDINPQIDMWYRMHPYLDGGVPRVIDLEVDNGDTPEHKAASVFRMSDLIYERDGIRPIIYSRRLLIDDWLKSWSTGLLNDHYWWLAQYLWDRTREHPGNPPTLPNRVEEDRVILHQTADKKAGFPGEAESSALDYDRWEIGSEEQMHQWIYDNWSSGTQPSHDEKVELLWWAHPELHGMVDVLRDDH